MSELFPWVPIIDLEAWIASEPTGQYARRAGFFYEYLTGRQLAFSGVVAGNYVPALDEDTYLTANPPVNNPRWRIRDNLPGTRDYCPLVLRTARDIDRIIRSVRENGGRMSGKLLKEFPLLTDAALAGEVVMAIEGAFTRT